MSTTNAALNNLRKKKKRRRKRRRRRQKHKDESSSSSSGEEEDMIDMVEVKASPLVETTEIELVEKNKVKGSKMEPRKIYVRYAYIPFISDICTASQTFTLRIDYDLYWKTTTADMLRWKKLKESEELDEYKPDFRPSLVLQNGVEIDLNEAQDQPTGSPWICKKDETLFGDELMNFVRYEVRGTFQQKMNTVHYPFDCQVLYIYMFIKYETVYDTIIVPCRNIKTGKVQDIFYLLDKFNAIQDWNVVRDQCGGEVKEDSSYPLLISKIVVHRKPWYVTFREYSFLLTHSLTHSLIRIYTNM
jgi:hypothetical protein